MTPGRSQALRAPAFIYRKDRQLDVQQLFCEKLPLRQLASRFGTPLYVYSSAALTERFRTLDRAFRKLPHTVCYSVKANSNLSLLRLLFRSGAGFDVVSGGELARVMKVSRKAAGLTVFSGVGKTAEEMDAALAAGILLFNVESESELRLLAARAAKLRKKAPMALRVNPDISAETHPYISTGLRQHKFGVPMSDALRLYQLAAAQPWLEVRGLSVHIGSQITSMQPFATAMGRLSELLLELQAAGMKISYVDIGGGLGIPYSHAEEDFAATANAYAAAVTRPLHGWKVHLLLEPGRSIAGPAGALLTRVLYLKSNGGKLFAVCDAAMNDLLRPALYDARHQIAPVVRSQSAVDLQKFDIVGPVCETGDFLARDCELPALSEGDLLAVLDAGAYGMSLASNYNSRPRPAEVLVEGRKTKLIRRRETIRDLLIAEC